MSARPRWRGIARALGAWPSSIRIGFDGLAPEHRAQAACDWGDVTDRRGGRRRLRAGRLGAAACRNRGAQC